MARGMDMPGVDCVISYDMPTHKKTYIHRAGRTARAGQTGRLFTLLRKEHSPAFQALLRKMRHRPVQTFKIDAAIWTATASLSQAALLGVSAVLAEEAAASMSDEEAAHAGDKR
jgi:ATP-dependent RNA helicase DDX51/DBP6